MKHPQNSRDAAGLAPPSQQQTPIAAAFVPAPCNNLRSAPAATPHQHAQSRLNHRQATQFHVRQQ